MLSVVEQIRSVSADGEDEGSEDETVLATKQAKPRRARGDM